MIIKPDAPFFVGYLKPPKKIRKFLLLTALFLAGFMAAAGIVIGSTQDDPGNGAFRFDYGRQTVTGVIENLAYPIFHVTKGNDRIKAGHTFMLSSSGKSGIIRRAKPFIGKKTTVAGVILQRGTLDMMQVSGRKGLVLADKDNPDEEISPPAPEKLGRWRLAGEICDGKCLAGAMRPGRGIAHKACANLCLTGDIPPVFVSTKPVEGSEFLMVLDRDGGPLPKAAYDFVAQYISLEGDVERRGNLLVFKIDANTIELM